MHTIAKFTKEFQTLEVTREKRSEASQFGSEQAAQDLCCSCGLCCDGTIFHFVEIDQMDDAAKIEDAGIKIHSTKGGLAFSLCCSALVNRHCQIYASRPIVCRKFRCKTLEAYRTQKISWQQAREKIHKVVRFREKIKSELHRIDPAFAEQSVAKLWSQWNDIPDGADRIRAFRTYGQALVQMLALRTFLARNFVWSNSKTDGPR